MIAAGRRLAARPGGHRSRSSDPDRGVVTRRELIGDPQQRAGRHPQNRAVQMNWLVKLYAWAIALLLAIVVVLHAVAALAAYLDWLVVLVILLIVLRLVWWYTNY